MVWRCYLHEGPCRLVEEKRGVSFEVHGNSAFRWWEVYDEGEIRLYRFDRKRDAKAKFQELTKE